MLLNNMISIFLHYYNKKGASCKRPTANSDDRNSLVFADFHSVMSPIVRPVAFLVHHFFPQFFFLSHKQRNQLSLGLKIKQ